MSKTKYSPFDEINALQRQIFIFIDGWVRTVKTPVPLQEILKSIGGTKERIPVVTIKKAVNALLYKGYIRRAETFTNKTSYVQMRNIDLEE